MLGRATWRRSPQWSFFFFLLCCLLTCRTVWADLDFIPLNREFIELLDDVDRYNRYATPTQYEGKATEVSMSMYIEGISSFSAQTMDYHLDVYFYQEWLDPRLAHNGSGPMLKNVRDRAIFNKIWHPDAYFANARYASFQTITEDNFLVWVYPDGHLWYDCRISIAAICMMDLWKYPLDAQQCNLRILSYAYPESQVRLFWSTTIEPPIDRNQNIKMPDMRLVEIKTGTWSCMTANFFVQREMMHHVIQTYIPTGLIVVISWFNFWLDIDSAPARVSLSITTLLNHRDSSERRQARTARSVLHETRNQRTGCKNKILTFWLESKGIKERLIAGVMIEFTIVHYNKNQPLTCGDQRPAANLVVDTTFSSLFGSLPTRESTGLSHTSIPIDDPRVKKLPQKNGQTMRSEDVADSRMAPLADTEPMLIKGDSYSGNGDPRLLDLHPDLVYRLANNGLPTAQSEPLRVNDPRMRPAVSKLKSQVSRRALNLRSTLCNLRGRRAATKIDEACRYLFPSAFFLFNIFYWTYYLLLN
ncbi:hypothetical protein M3Y99_01477800 [Aphelenchoides fujianensis]|nr:hypothetical protein M3Y99_01477800 [Aphelenchoides fujianensis]